MVPSGRPPIGLVRMFLLIALLVVALPAAAGASTVQVAPFREVPDPSGAPGCAKIMLCPQDMVVFSAAPGEANDISITAEMLTSTEPVPRSRFVVRDRSLTPMQAGTGCERIETSAVACVAGTLGPVDLGDLGDRILTLTSGGDVVSGGAGDDLLSVTGGAEANGGDGDDIVVGQKGKGGDGDDVLSGTSGEGGAGDDILRCFPAFAFCDLEGGTGNDRLIGGGGQNMLSGGGGRDSLAGRGGNDTLTGGSGNDRLRGGGGQDKLRGGAGSDRLDARELRSRGERTVKDNADCGTGRRDRALASHGDVVRRCELVVRERRRISS